MSTTTEKPTSDSKVETFEFKAESRQLLDIVIHSLYTNKEIFLRELISNASDALDRVRFEAVSDPGLLEKDETLEIRLDLDSEARTLTITDNGIGMSRDEVIANIGTIAKSGSRELMEKLKKSTSGDAMTQLIGQFGVGFYSAFMVADKVTLVTRRAGADGAIRWESSADGTYELGEGHLFQRGTQITLHLKPVDQEHGVEDFTDFWAIQSIVKRHSDFVAYPIRCKHEHEDWDRDDDGNIIESSRRTVTEEKTLNSMKPIWTRPAEEVKEEEYTEFYRHISHDWNSPLDSLSLKAEGRIEYQSLLFFPEKAPMDLFYRDQEWGLQLYVRRVLIMDGCQDLLPGYLRFLRGVVDSADLQLNISRETVQQDRHITQIRKWLTRKVLDHLAKMQENDDEKYQKFWHEFGRLVKEGPSSDPDNKDRINKLLLFQSSNDPEKLTTLADYVSRMKDGQEEIFYLTGESREVVASSPHLEAFEEKGYEVLFMVDPVDEILSNHVMEYDGKKLQSIGKGTIELGTEEERKQAEEALEEKKESNKDLMKFLEGALDEWIKEVRLSTRLVSSPVCLVGAEHDMSPQLERLLRQTEAGGEMDRQKRIMELNPDHDLFKKLGERFSADKEDALLDDYAHLLLGYAMLAEGSELPEPNRFNRLVGELMLKGL